MTKTIPMTAGLAHQRFRTNLSGKSITIRLHWQTRYGLYNVDLYDGEKPITLGRALHPGIDLLHGLNLGLGKLYLEGEAPTPENLGLANKLRHEPA